MALSVSVMLGRASLGTNPYVNHTYTNRTSPPTGGEASGVVRALYHIPALRGPYPEIFQILTLK